MAIFPKAAYLVTGNVLVAESSDIEQGRKECHIETTDAMLVKTNWAILDVLKKILPSASLGFELPIFDLCDFISEICPVY